jgi:predicted nuclease of predicted toxin-antitoxin system
VRLLLDEMYSRDIAKALQERGLDVVAVGDRDDLRAGADEVIFEAAQREQRVIVTNNASDFMPLAERALQGDSPFCGLVLTSDRSLPRSKHTIGVFTELLGALLAEHADLDALPTRIEWLAP